VLAQQQVEDVVAAAKLVHVFPNQAGSINAPFPDTSDGQKAN
jgi:hypothetical protein